MDNASEQVMLNYAEAYQRLYNRIPADLRAIDNDWVIVNGARMRTAELAYLTRQLQREYTQGLAQQRGIVSRLISWFKG